MDSERKFPMETISSFSFCRIILVPGEIVKLPSDGKIEAGFGIRLCMIVVSFCLMIPLVSLTSQLFEFVVSGTVNVDVRN